MRWGARNPYKGLRAFEEEDAADFFGRQRLVGRLVAALASSRLLALVGPSGSGKSSVVAAGLIPAIRTGAVPGSERWLVASMQPGRHPSRALEAALRRSISEPPSGAAGLFDDDDPWAARAEQVAANLHPTGTAPGPLTAREEQVVELVSRGLTNRAIAKTLVVSERTAQNHVQHILTKLGFTARSQIAAWVVSRRQTNR